VQVAEVQFFRRVSSGWTDSLPTTTVSATITLNADFNAIGSDVDTEGYVEFVSGFKTDTAALLGVNEEQIVVNSVLAGSVVVSFTVVPDEDGHSLSVVALATTFSRPGISLAGATTTSTITSAGVTVEAVTVSLTANSGDAVRASGAEPQEDDKSVVGMVLFVVLFALAVLGVAYACGTINVQMPQMPNKWGQQSRDNVEVTTDSKPMDGDEDNVDHLEEGLPPPLPSVARIELARCLRAGTTADPGQVHRQFDELDIDHDGTLTKEEVERFVTQTLGYSPSADFLNGVFAAFDQDCSGTLSEEEFAQMLKILRTHADDEQLHQQQP
jgi:hypothetical protein